MAIGTDASFLLPLWEKVDRRDSGETDEGCSSGVRRWRSLEHPSSVAFGDTARGRATCLAPSFGPHKGRRKNARWSAAQSLYLTTNPAQPCAKLRAAGKHRQEISRTYLHLVGGRLDRPARP